MGATGHGVRPARRPTGLSGIDREGRRVRTESAASLSQEGPCTYEAARSSPVQFLFERDRNCYQASCSYKQIWDLK